MGYSRFVVLKHGMTFATAGPGDDATHAARARLGGHVNTKKKQEVDNAQSGV